VHQVVEAQASKELLEPLPTRQPEESVESLLVEPTEVGVSAEALVPARIVVMALVPGGVVVVALGPAQTEFLLRSQLQIISEASLAPVVVVQGPRRPSLLELLQPLSPSPPVFRVVEVVVRTIGAPLVLV
jgi:hypothetical protein